MDAQPVSSQPTGTGSGGEQPRSINKDNNGDTMRPPSAFSSTYSLEGEGNPEKRKCMCCCSPRGKLVRRCCCVRESGGDQDPDAWNYPWDKNVPKCVGLCCMWYAFCLVFPCSLCLPPYRDMLCCVQEGCWDGTCCGACLFGLPPPGSKPRPHGNRTGSRVSHWSDSS